MIESLGYGAEAVGNGIEAVEACSRQTYEAILMDCQMPADGRLQGHGLHPPARGPEPPHADHRLTASVTAEDRQRCLSAGMDDYLSKPVPRKRWPARCASGSRPRARRRRWRPLPRRRRSRPAIPALLEAHAARAPWPK